MAFDILLLMFSSSPFAYVDPLHCNMAYLYLELLKDSLNEYAYAAELAGLNYDLQNTIYGMYVSTQNEGESWRPLLPLTTETSLFSGSIFKMALPIEGLTFFLKKNTPWFLTLLSHNLNFKLNLFSESSITFSSILSKISLHFLCLSN